MPSNAPLSDSLSRCDPDMYSGIHRANSHPDFKKVVSGNSSKDSIESVKDEIQKEALERLRHTKTHLIVQNGFMRIGKYLFTGVVFPPYFVLYKIPKWVVLVLIAPIISIMVHQVAKITTVFKQRVEVMVQRVGMLLQKAGTAFNVLVQPIIRLALDIKNAIQRMRVNVSKLMSRMTNPVKNFYLNRFKKSKNENRSVFEKIGQALNSIKKGLSAPIQKMILKPFLQFKRLCESSINRFKSIGNEAASHMISFKKVITDFFRIRLSIINRATENLEERIKSLGSKIKYPFARGYSVFAKFIANGLRSLKHVFGNKFFKLREFFEKKGRQFATRMDAGLFALKALSNRKHFRFSFNWLPDRRRNQILRFFDHPLVQKIFSILLKSLYYALNPAWTGFLWIMRMLDLGLNRCVDLLGVICQFVNGGIKIVSGHSSNVLALIVEYFVKGLRYLLVFSVMLGYIMVWGFQAMHRKSRNAQ